MKSDKDIEAWIRSTDPDTQANRDETVWQHILQARRRAQQGDMGQNGQRNRVFRMQALKVAALLLLVLSMGLVIGRIPGPSASQRKAALVAEIRAAVRHDLEQQWATNSAEATDRLQHEMLLVLRQALGESQKQTRAANQAYTEQRLRDLIQAIDKTRAEDRHYVSTALERMEFHRQQNRDLIKRGIVALTLQAQDRPTHEVN